MEFLRKALTATEIAALTVPLTAATVHAGGQIPYYPECASDSHIRIVENLGDHFDVYNFPIPCNMPGVDLTTVYYENTFTRDGSGIAAGDPVDIPQYAPSGIREIYLERQSQTDNLTQLGQALDKGQLVARFHAYDNLTQPVGKQHAEYLEYFVTKNGNAIPARRFITDITISQQSFLPGQPY